MDDKEIHSDELLLQAIDNEEVIFKDLAVDFNDQFKEIPPDEIVLPTNEVPPISSSDEEL